MQHKLLTIVMALLSMATVHSQVIYDNGPLVNSLGTGVGGADESVLQSSSLSASTLGFGFQVSDANRIADDFTVPSALSYKSLTPQVSFFSAYSSLKNRSFSSG